MYWILGLSLLLNAFLIFYWFLNRKHVQQTSSQIKKIIDGQSKVLLKQSGHSKQQNVLVKEINQLIEELNETSARFNRISKQNKQMMSSISHDFRTPLTSMLGYIQILKKEAFTANEEKYLEIIEERTRTLSSLVEEFYTLSLLESDEYQAKVDFLNPILLVQEQLALYYNELNQSFDAIKVKLKEENDTIQTSIIDLKRIVGNLIKNAIVHGVDQFEVRGIRNENSLSFIFENKVENSELIEIDRIFERLYRADENRSSGSTGLGLSIAQRLSERLGFELNAELNGSLLSFTLVIPIENR